MQAIKVGNSQPCTEEVGTEATERQKGIPGSVNGSNEDLAQPKTNKIKN